MVTDVLSFRDGDRGAQARDWVMRVRDPDFAAWDAFTDWLEADPANNAAYDLAADADERIAKMVAAVPEAAPLPVPANDAPPRRWSLIVGGSAVAASLALLVGVAVVNREVAGTTRTIATAPGEHRTVELASGDQVVLNGDTRLVIDSAAPRQATIERGQALFAIHHDAANPFVVLAGNHRLLDAGTKFEVTMDKAATSVSVSEGMVIYEPSGPAVKLGVGTALRVGNIDGKVAVSKIAPEAVGSWKDGTLFYVDAPLDRVAADLSRNFGEDVRLSAGARRFDRFTGTLGIDGKAGSVLPRVAPLLGVAVRRDDHGWVLAPSGN